ncbi:MAG TPA: chemotaxis protein CheA [Vicinamibacterales bacterium]|nr:chemotaxis protein CheA [Vicinamibacterales bacterium]
MDPRSAPVFENDKELTAVFVGEALDHLGSIEASVLALEESARDSTAVNDVFRLFHTLKSNAGALGLTTIEHLSHAVEDLLGRVRDGDYQIRSVDIEIILAVVDLLLQMVREVEATGTCADDGDLASRQAVLKAAIEQLLEQETDPSAVASGVMAPIDSDEGSVDKRLERNGLRQASIKVDTRKLDNLIDLVGELVIVQSMLYQNARALGRGDERLDRNLAQFQRLSNELHTGAIAMRLVPIRQTFQRMQRLVRDLSKKAGKPVDLTILGDDTEIDRKVVEEIGDPLLHMLRNSVDHGIEDADTRARAGKPARGQLTLSAAHEGGHVLISVSDDGRGLDMDRLLERGIAAGLIEPGARPSEAEIQSLIFAAGFSTAKEVTELSGRGVGMDVVRRNIESLRGRIEIRSRPGAGTTFLLKLPLTLSTIEALLLKVADERFVLATFSVRESLRPARERLHAMPGGRWMVEVRNELMPIVRVADLFNIPGGVTDPTRGALVVIEDTARRVALMVDELVCKQSVVIKALGEPFNNVEGIAGGAILADGRIGLILDAGGLIRLCLQESPGRAA